MSSAIARPPPCKGRAQRSIPARAPPPFEDPVVHSGHVACQSKRTHVKNPYVHTEKASHEVQLGVAQPTGVGQDPPTAGAPRGWGCGGCSHCVPASTLLWVSPFGKNFFGPQNVGWIIGRSGGGARLTCTYPPNLPE